MASSSVPGNGAETVSECDLREERENGPLQKLESPKYTLRAFQEKRFVQRVCLFLGQQTLDLSLSLFFN